MSEDPFEGSEQERHCVELARKGSLQAVGELYERFLPRVYRYVTARVGRLQDAEDVTAEVFVKMVKALPRYEDRRLPFGAWLFKLARNEVISFRRRSGSGPQLVGLEERSALSLSDPGEKAEQAALLGEVRAAVKALPEAQRDVVTLRLMADLSIAETARVLDKREGTVKVLQHKALERLQRQLGSSSFQPAPMGGKAREQKA